MTISPSLTLSQHLKFFTFFALLFLSGCSGKKEEVYEERPVEVLFNKAMDELLRGKYEEAAHSFEEVERQHPYSNWATLAQLRAAFAYYEAQQYEKAVMALEVFIRLHPGSPYTPYAYYLQGMCYYEQVPNAERDLKLMELALKAFEEVKSRYPDSIYARDSRYKIDLLKDRLASKDMHIGRYYLREGLYLAALNRFKSVIAHYQQTSHVPEALHRLVEVYLALGLKEQAKENAAVLGYNFPESEWYKDSYNLMVQQGLAAPLRKGAS